MAGVTTYSCTKCRPVDTEIIEAYLVLTNTSKAVSQQEADRVTAEQGRVTAENERERVFGLDHGTATDDHATAVSDHGIAGDDHLLAVADHGTAGDDHTIAAGDHVTAGEDHLASTSATSRANDAAAAAEHMVDIHQGPPGADGHDGHDGQDGTGITEIEQTVTSHANGGQNTVQIRTSDGNSYNVYIKNGSASNGLFPTSSALNTACPSPAVGDFAYVGSGFPADIYVCQTAGTWVDSGEDYDGDNVDLTDYATKAEVTQLEAKVTDYATGKYYGTFPSASLLPDGMTIPGYAYVGMDNPFAIYNFDGTSWTDSGATMDGMNIPSLNPFKGMYVSVAALEAVYPNPLVGDYAYVKNSGTPATANIYSESGGAWTDTGIVVSITDMESVFPMYAKLQLLYTLEKVAWTDGNAPTYLSDLRTALLGSATLVSVDATFTPGTAVILDTMSLDDLRQYLVVAATFSDGSVEVVTGYQLSGLMTTGTNTITVTYLGETDTFSVNVVHNYAGLLSTWTLHPASSVAEYTNGAVRMKCANTTDQDGYGVWCADCKTSLWSAVNGKTLKFRVKANSKSASVVVMGAGVFENANITSLGATKAKRKSFAENDLILSADGYYEINFVCDINNFTNGTLTPNASSTFGLWAYARSLRDYIEYYDLQVFEVTP